MQERKVELYTDNKYITTNYIMKKNREKVTLVFLFHFKQYLTVNVKLHLQTIWLNHYFWIILTHQMAHVLLTLQKAS